MSTTITPASGAGILLTQQGAGTTPGYSAIDIRRLATLGLSQGPVGGAGYGGGVGSGAYAVTGRQAGVNMSVDIAANIGNGLAVAGTTIADQGLYIVPPHSTVINEAIAPADLTNPRVDQVIVQCLDNVIDGSAGNRAQTIVLTGTPTAGATIGVGGNRNGAAALPANSYRLADVIVAAGVGSIVNASIVDRRPKTRGWCNVVGAESRTNTAYGTMPTADQVAEIVLPANGLIRVWYQAAWSESVANAAKAAIFLNANQQQVFSAGSSMSSQPVFARTGSTGAGENNKDRGLFSTAIGLVSTSDAILSNYSGDVTTGQAVGGVVTTGGTSTINYDAGGACSMPAGSFAGGSCDMFAAAGTYTVSIRFLATSGSVEVNSRKLWVQTMSPDQAVL